MAFIPSIYNFKWNSAGPTICVCNTKTTLPRWFGEETADDFFLILTLAFTKEMQKLPG